ncbi:hypothetical protein EVAR_63939_1 [Eumeta japonica]|uniref:Uncharacterized protein n=1 Tax=Eumeta variegata TaxID=151549 RepID=A0A4C1ZI27_EUMVA|nr:hypothetical protein EVAR_63939_1 [Eumeta japonica]
MVVLMVFQQTLLSAFRPRWTSLLETALLPQHDHLATKILVRGAFPNRTVCLRHRLSVSPTATEPEARSAFFGHIPPSAASHIPGTPLLPPLSTNPRSVTCLPPAWRTLAVLLVAVAPVPRASLRPAHPRAS